MRIRICAVGAGNVAKCKIIKWVSRCGKTKVVVAVSTAAGGTMTNYTVNVRQPSNAVVVVISSASEIRLL